jgi:50S ribosome-binding GTPase
MERTVVLLGRVGHGKTHLFNKLCGTSHLSAMTASSCTRGVVEACTLRRKVKVVDTPGFGSSDATDSHVEAQRRAIESHDLSGIILVVKYGSPSDMANGLNHIMDFVGTDNVAIIVTHAECVLQKEQPIDDILIRATLSRLLGVGSWKILLVGKDTNSSRVEEFIFSRLEPPKRIQIDHVQLRFASTHAVGARRFKLDIERANLKTNVALQSCQALLASFDDDMAVRNLVMRVRDETAQHVDEILRRLTLESKALSPEVQKSLRCITEESLIPPLDALKRLEVSTVASPDLAAKVTSPSNGPSMDVLYLSQRSRIDEAQGRAESLSSPKRSLATPEHVESGRAARRCPGTFVSEAVRRFESPLAHTHEYHFSFHSPTDVQGTSTNFELEASASPLSRLGSRLPTSKEIGANLPAKILKDSLVGRSIADKVPHLPGKTYRCIETRHAKVEDRHGLLEGGNPHCPVVAASSVAPYSPDDWEVIMSRHRVTTPTTKCPNPLDETTQALDVFLSDDGRGSSATHGPHPKADSDRISR